MRHRSVQGAVGAAVLALCSGAGVAYGGDCNDRSFSGGIVCSALGSTTAGNPISAVIMTESDGRGGVSGIQKVWDGATEQTIPFTGTYSVSPNCLASASTTIGTFTFAVAKDKSVKFQATSPGFVLAGDCQPSK